VVYPGPGQRAPVKQADLGCAVGWNKGINSAGVTAFGVVKETGQEEIGNCRPAIVEGGGKGQGRKTEETYAK